MATARATVTVDDPRPKRHPWRTLDTLIRAQYISPMNNHKAHAYTLQDPPVYMPEQKLVIVPGITSSALSLNVNQVLQGRERGRWIATRNGLVQFPMVGPRGRRTYRTFATATDAADALVADEYARQYSHT